MTREKLKEVIDACYQAKRIRDMLLALPGGIAPSQIHCLDTLRKLEGSQDYVKVSDISDRLGLPRPGVTKTFKDLEKLGLVEKKSTDADGRYVYITITGKGKEHVEKYIDRYFSSLSEELEEISDEEADQMIEVVESLYTVISRRKKSI